MVFTVSILIPGVTFAEAGVGELLPCTSAPEDRR